MYVYIYIYIFIIKSARCTPFTNLFWHVSCQNKFVKWVYLFGCIIKKFVTMHGHRNVIYIYIYISYIFILWGTCAWFLYFSRHEVIIIIIIIIIIIYCNWVVTRWQYLHQYRQNEWEEIYINETVQKHSTNNTKHGKYKYTYYQNTHAIVKNTHTLQKPTHYKTS